MFEGRYVKDPEDCLDGSQITVHKPICNIPSRHSCTKFVDDARVTLSLDRSPKGFASIQDGHGLGFGIPGLVFE
ncbi:hypothetical protein RRF57_009487 [Xylaria bambusicola]|uniref:Uncharacterized protein n=1 Tax=Xylaria bambusicola TaxID=326684 RepID=A0AAN7UTM4_9PEZI